MSFEMTTLPNGMRVASEHLPGLETVAVAVSVNVGARYEAAEDGGISHMLEHMAFKGTARRDARKIAEEFDDIGGHLNAYTSLEQTVYYAKVLKQHLPLAVDMLADILQHSQFTEEELVRERQVILQEIAMHYDTPDDLIFDHFHEAAFPGQPLGRSILGQEARVATFSQDDMRRYMAAFYHPSRMVLSVAGNVKHDALVKLASEHFTMPASYPSIQAEPAHYVGGDARRARELEQLHVMMGLRGVSVFDPDYYALQLFSTVLGGGMSSRLFQEVREKRGLAYTVQSFVSAYADNGILGIYAATGEEKGQELVPVLCEEITKIAESGVTETELRRAKNQQVAGLLMARESASSVAEWIGRHLLIFGEYRTAKDITARVEAVAAADVERVATRLLKGGQVTFAALGPLGELEAYERVQERLAA